MRNEEHRRTKTPDPWGVEKGNIIAHLLSLLPGEQSPEFREGLWAMSVDQLNRYRRGIMQANESPSPDQPPKDWLLQGLKKGKWSTYAAGSQSYCKELERTDPYLPNCGYEKTRVVPCEGQL